MKNVLVLCTGNSCRSQMLHGFLNQILDGKAHIYSAGIETHGLNSDAVKTMANSGLDISHHTSNHVLEYENVDFDYIITVCDHAYENCPYIPGNAVRIHHSFIDPSKVKGTEEEVAHQFAVVRDQIKAFAIEFKDVF